MHRICKMTFASAIAVVFILAALGGRAAPSGSAVAEVAPLAALTPKAITLGKLLANPLVPALLVSSLQQNLTTSYGRLRSDKPLFWAFPRASSRTPPVPVLPCAEGIAQFTLNHPGATRGPDGSVHLLAAEGRPDEMVVVFAPDGYAAFALNAESARAALAATASARRNCITESGDPVARMSITREAIAAAVADAGVVGTNSAEIVSLVGEGAVSICLDEKGLELVFDISPAPGVPPESLCAEFKKSIAASVTAFGAADGVKPVCTAKPVGNKAHLSISLPASEMKKAGKAFNATVVQALANEKKGK